MENNKPPQVRVKDTKSPWPILIACFILFGIGIRLLMFIGDYKTDSKLLEISYRGWVTEDYSNNLLKITEARADIISTIYVTEFLSSTPEEVFIPLVSTDSSYIDNEVRILLRVTHGPMFDKVLELVGSSEEAILTDYINNPHEYSVEGPFEGYKADLDEDTYDKLREAEPNLARRHRIMNLGAGYPYGTVIALSLIWLAALAFVIYQFFGKKKKKK